MSADSFLLSPVDLTINQDWSKVIPFAQNLIKLSKTHHSEVKLGSEYHDNNSFYHLGPLGSVSDHEFSENWHIIHSPYLFKYMPWLLTLLDDMKELDVTWGISIAIGDAAEHTDKKTYPCALNYPINTTQANTYIKYENQEYTYPSIADQPWILNTQYPHGVRNTEERYVFNIHFSADYTTVKNWFDSKPGLVYG